MKSNPMCMEMLDVLFVLRKNLSIHRFKMNTQDALTSNLWKITLLEDSVLEICHERRRQRAKLLSGFSGHVLKGRDVLLCLE